MAYGAPSAATGPYGACGTIARVEARTKNKKAGGTYEVNIATLDNGIEVDFGFKPVEGRVGETVSWATMKEYGSYKFRGVDGAAGTYQLAFPPKPKTWGGAPPSGGAPAPSAPAGDAPRPTYGKPFPLPREHGDTAIIRQNALTNAVQTHNGCALAVADSLELYSDSIIKLAYKYANFSSGNLDAILAEDLAQRTATKAAGPMVAAIKKAAG